MKDNENQIKQQRRIMKNNENNNETIMKIMKKCR